MKKVINKNRVRLVFPKYDLAIEPDQIKEVTDEQYEGVIQHVSIEEVVREGLKKEGVEETVKEDRTLNNKKSRKL